MQTIKFEKIPKSVQNIVGQAQKHLTLLEGEARNYITGTYTKIKQYPSVRKIEDTFEDITSRYKKQFAITPIRKKVEKISTDVSNKAFATIGVATKTDIKSITRKINKLRGEIKKFAGKKFAKTKK